MCGFFGVFSSAPIEARRADRIREVLNSRGPDGSGTFIAPDQSVMLIHTRLAILDLHTRALQPFTTQSGRYTIAYNGEVYNYRELGRELTDAGVSLRTTSDTEVVAEGFELWGEQFIRRLEGMFSISIHDSAEDVLWLFRDPYGIKPLLYCSDAGRFLFSTSAQAILAYEPQLGIDVDALREFLANGFIMEPNSLYRDVQWLGHAEYLRVTKSDNAVHVEKRTMEWPAAASVSSSLCGDVEQSIHAHEISDVPVAATLSGGFDSGMIAWSADSISRFYTATYGTRLNDRDLASAKHMAALREKEHVLVPVTAEDYRYYMEDVRRYDLPCLEYSQIPLTTVYRRMKEDNFKVVLSGDGADELLFGYRYMRHLLKDRRDPASAIINRSARGRSSGRIGKLLRRYGYYGTNESVDNRHFNILRARIHERSTAWGDEYRDHGVRAMLGIYFGNADQELWQKVRTAEIRIGLRNKMLPKVDRASMAESVEVRVPFISRLVERNGALTFRKGKVESLRQCMSKDERHFFRLADKRGFNPPLGAWISESGLADELTAKSNIADALHLSSATVSALLHDFRSGDNTAAQTVHALLVMNRFLQ